MSIFLWRLISNRIPVDTKLQWRGIDLASKCKCCRSSPGIESLQHLFISGQGASDVWTFFDDWFPGNTHPIHPSNSIPDRMLLWSHRLKHHKVNHLSRSVPLLIFWFLWAERNNSLFNEEVFRPHNVIWQVTMHVKRLILNGVIGPLHWHGCNPPADLGCSLARRPRERCPEQVKWHPPEETWVKLNVAGDCVAPQTSGFGGGILRDKNGCLLSAYRINHDNPNIWEAELLAISHGLSVARSFSRNIEIESNVAQTISLLKNGNLGPARTRFAVAGIRTMGKDLNLRFSFVPRAGNMIAISLAKGSFGEGSLSFFDSRNAPSTLKSMVRRERCGIHQSEWREDSQV